MSDGHEGADTTAAISPGFIQPHEHRHSIYPHNFSWTYGFGPYAITDPHPSKSRVITSMNRAEMLTWAGMTALPMWMGYNYKCIVPLLSLRLIIL